MSSFHKDKIIVTFLCIPQSNDWSHSVLRLLLSVRLPAIFNLSIFFFIYTRCSAQILSTKLFLWSSTFKWQLSATMTILWPSSFRSCDPTWHTILHIQILLFFLEPKRTWLSLTSPICKPLSQGLTKLIYMVSHSNPSLASCQFNYMNKLKPYAEYCFQPWKNIKIQLIWNCHFTFLWNSLCTDNIFPNSRHSLMCMQILVTCFVRVTADTTLYHVA